MNTSLTDALRPEVRTQLHQTILDKLQLIDDEDFSLVAYKTRVELAKRGKDITDDELAELIFSLKQYYAVALLDPLNAHAVSIVVDDPWHMHILDTRGYESFCKRVYNEVLPHVHLDFNNKPHVEEIARLYAYTVEMLDKMFTVVKAEHYPSPESQPEEEIIVCKHCDVQDALIRSYAIFQPDARGRSHVTA